MIHLACKIPKKVTLACSGGKDSMSALSFLLKGRREITIAYYDHGTLHGREAYNFVKSESQRLGLEFVSDNCSISPPPKVSKEAFWREKRYDFFKKIHDPIITAHHLDDAVEWWIFSSLRGNPSLMPIKREAPFIIRPFLFSSKDSLHKQLDVKYIQDPSNQNTKFARNYIRHKLHPLCLNVNPGLSKTVKNLYSKERF